MGKRSEHHQSAVLAVLKARRAPLSAYEVLDALNTSERPLAPTTVYRALSALLERGQIHRLESRNAFVACQGACREASQGGSEDGSQDACATILAVCDGCGAVEETVSTDVNAALSQATGRTGFTASRHVIELIGRCAACDAAGASQ